MRLIVYTIGMVYLFLDLFVFDGPLRQRIRSRDIRSAEQIAAAKAEGIVARIYGQPILLTQVDRRAEERLWKEGRTWEDVPEVERKVLRMAALNDLIDLRLLGRIKVWSNQGDYPVPDEEIDAAMERFRRKFDTPGALAEGLRQQGWTEEELRMRLAAKLQQDKYLAAMIDLTVSEEEAREFYEAHRNEFGLPRRVQVRHLFLSADRYTELTANRWLEEALRRLERGEVGFEVLAREHGGDPLTGGSGGEPGWLEEGRLPEAFAELVLTLDPGERGVVRSDRGWHLVEVMARREAGERIFEEVRPEIELALRAIKREEGIQGYRNQLRALEKDKVEVFEDLL